MLQYPPTTTSVLLNSLLDPSDQFAWTEFDARYRPILSAVLRKRGVPEVILEDVVQQTMLEFVRDYRLGKYDRSRGRLRTWLLTIGRHQGSDAIRALIRRQDRYAPVGQTAIDQLADEAAVAQDWDDEYRASVAGEAMERLRASRHMSPKTLQAFELTQLQELPIADAAKACGMTIKEVHVARCRVNARLRELIEEVDALYSECA